MNGAAAAAGSAPSASPSRRLWRETAAFLALSLTLGAGVFRGGMVGRCLLAPLDILPAFFTHYAFLAPSDGAPANHHIIDQVTYDLPLQYSIYGAYRRGEMPWWDAYTFGGRPLLADAHISGTDPIRVILYRLLPFVWAYNWTRIAHFLVSGLGLFLLLRRNGSSLTVASGLSLAYEFAGGFALFFGHPWIHASFAYYPLLWLLWQTAVDDRRPLLAIPAGATTACALYAGNLQSHTYLALFAAAFAAGNLAAWRRMAAVVSSSLALGACLAAPMLLAEGELWLLNVRPVAVESPAAAWASGLLSLLAAPHPWVLGTFRTLDVGRAVRLNGAGFHLFVGPVAVVCGLAAPFLVPSLRTRPLPRTGLALLVVYLVVISTPLRNVFYSRCAPLAALGLIVLAAAALDALAHPAAAKSRLPRHLGAAVLALTLAVALATHAAAWVVYPRVRPAVQRVVENHASASLFGARLRALRAAQMNAFAAEITVRNPEVALGLLGLLAAGALLLLPANRRRAAAVLPAVLILNVLPVVLFAGRFIPRQPVRMWEDLLAGGPSQRRLMEACGGQSWRIFETPIPPAGGSPALPSAADSVLDEVVPFSLAHLYRIRTLDGYSALQPRSLYHRFVRTGDLPWRSVVDAIAITRGDGALEFWGLSAAGWAPPWRPPAAKTGTARFHWSEPAATNRTLDILRDAPGDIRIAVGPGTTDTVLGWTDTRYPGWRASFDGRPVTIDVFDLVSTLQIPPHAGELRLRYRPTGLAAGIVLAWLAALAAAAAALRTQLPRTTPAAATGP